MDPVRLAVARAIAAERERVEMSQADLADRLGWSPGVVSHIETGRRPVSMEEAPRICEALGITVPLLLIRAPEEARRLYGLS